MSKKRLDRKIIDQIVKLRETGHSLPEIRKAVQKGNATVFKYIQGISVLPEYRAILKAKQGGSKERSKKQWIEAEKRSKESFDKLSQREKILILVSLYWAEGNKKDLNMINSDPEMIRIFIECLESIGIMRSNLTCSLRIYSDMDQKEIVNYWMNHLGINRGQIGTIEILTGKEKGKLEFGMCRIRVKKGAPSLKFITSIINRIKEIV